MGILDSFRKNREEKKEHATPPPQGHTLAQILQDKNKSYLFGQLLERDGNKDLAQRMAEGKLEESDIALLEEKRLIFSEKITQAEKVEKWITKENLIDLARNNPEFGKIINLVGPEKAIKAIQNQLKDISINDENRFNAIISAMEVFESYKNGEYKEINDKVEKFLKDNKITSQEYITILAIENPLEKEKALKKLATKSYGTYDKICNFLSGGEFSRGTFEDLQNSETSLEDSVTKLNTLQADMSSVLSSSLRGNDSMRNALFSELINEKAPEEHKSGFKEAKNGTFDKEKLDEEMDEDWEKEKRHEGYGAKNPAQKKVIEDRFKEKAKTYYREKNKGEGFWYDIFSAIMEEFINDKKLS